MHAKKDKVEGCGRRISRRRCGIQKEGGRKGEREARERESRDGGLVAKKDKEKQRGKVSLWVCMCVQGPSWAVRLPGFPLPQHFLFLPSTLPAPAGVVAELLDNVSSATDCEVHINGVLILYILNRYL